MPKYATIKRKEGGGDVGHPELIVMLTKDDRTVQEAYELFWEHRACKAKYFGIKEQGLSIDRMRALFDAIRLQGKIGVLEVVAYTEEACLEGAHLAAECGCAILMGTLFYESVNDYCRKHGVRYMPFVGDVSGRPSLLCGSVEQIAAEARKCVGKGAYGVDLLGYRYDGNTAALVKAVTKSMDAPVCLAGSINSYERLDEVVRLSPAFFTVGGAFFDHVFGEDFTQQVDTVYEYVRRKVERDGG